MNLMSIEVRVSTIHIQLREPQQIAFSLRLGTILSPISQSFTMTDQSIIEPNCDLLLTCDASVLESNMRACLVIYSVDSHIDKNILGMVFIQLDNSEDQICRKYKIQQSSDPHAHVMLQYSIGPLELKRNERDCESQASRSSLAEVREFHKVLSKERRHHRNSSGSDYDTEGFEMKKQNRGDRLSPQSKDPNISKKKQPHIKSESNCEEGDPSYIILLKKAQADLAKQRQKTGSLINLLALEQEKTRESGLFIEELIKKICQNALPPQDNSNIPNGVKQAEVRKDACQNMNPQPESQSQDYYETIIKQRDELYSISQDLYEKTKLYKRENQQLKRSLRQMENNLKLCIEQNEFNKSQNVELKQKIFDLSDQLHYNGETSNANQELMERLKMMELDGLEKERKIKESMRAMQEFRNDAWRANEELIIKEGQTKMLKQQIQSLRDRLEHAGVGQKNESYSQSIFQDNRLEHLKNLFSLIKLNSLNRASELQKIKQLHLRKERQAELEVSAELVLRRLKDSINAWHNELKREGSSMIKVMDMRQRLMLMINGMECREPDE